MTQRLASRAECESAVLAAPTGVVYNAAGGARDSTRDSACVHAPLKATSARYATRTPVLLSGPTAATATAAAAADGKYRSAVYERRRSQWPP